MQVIIKTMMMCSTFASILVPLLLIPVVQKIGKRNVALYGGAGMGIAGQIVLILFAEQSMGLMYLGLILRGMGVACISATKFGMIADSIEYGEYKTGTRAEGFVYSAASLGVRVGSALASAVIGWVLGAYGYDGKLAVQSETAMKHPHHVLLCTISCIYCYSGTAGVFINWTVSMTAS